MAIAPSFQDLLAQGQAEAQARAPRLLFLEGDMTLAQLHGAAAMADIVLRYAAQAFKETFLDGAKNDALTTLVEDHFNITRTPAAPAQVTLTFARTSGGVAGTIPVGALVSSEPDASGAVVVYALDAAVSIGAGANGPWTVAATATETGPAANVAPGQLVRILTALFDPTFTVTNAAAGDGGHVEESDEELRRRARTFLLTLWRGTLAALEHGARRVAGVHSARAFEDPVTKAVTVQVSDENGGSTLQMVAEVTNELENWRPAGVHVQVIGGRIAVADVAIVINKWQPGFDPSTVFPAVIDLVTARINRLKPGEGLYRAEIAATTLNAASGEICSIRESLYLDGVLLPDNVAGIVPGPGQVLRPGSITVTAG
jgi:uncharacterized phage protein gp47/JayE